MVLASTTPDRVSILLVDDKPNNLIALEAILAAPDYHLVSALSGASALEKMKVHDFAVILTDVMMPIMDGFEFAAQVKGSALWRDIPIIFLTAMASDVANVFRGYEVGAVDYLQKPLEPEVVKAKVAVFVQLYRQRWMNKRQAQELLASERMAQEYRLAELRRAGQLQNLRIKAALRDNAAKSRIERLQSVHLEVTRILSEPVPLAAAIPSLLQTIARGFCWDWAAFWRIDRESQTLRVLDHWCDPASESLAAFSAASLSLSLRRGEQPPGVAWESERTEWELVRQHFAGSARAPLAADIGLHRAIAVPIFDGSEVVGVAEFIGRRKAFKDDFSKAILTDIGTRVGMYLQRLRIEQSLRDSEEKFRRLVDELDTKVRERTAELETTNEALRSEVVERQRIENLLRTNQQELRRAKDLAEAGSSAKSAFLANMSHEIRTPLGAVMGFSELLLMQDQSASEKVNCVSAIKRNGKLLSKIINDILDLSKVEAGKLDVERVPIRLDDIMADLKALLNFEAAEKGLNFSVSTKGDVPMYITSDPLRLRQILLNIVGNAIKFTERGSIDVCITRCGNKQGQGQVKGTLAFIVTDTGLGMTSRQAAQLFEPFAQADSSTTRRFGGTGLGLALSKQLAVALGGTIELTHSEMDRGSTFTVTIDPGDCVAAASGLGPLEVKRSAARSIGESVRLPDITILLADDSLDNQLLVSRVLRMAGARVDAVANGREAVARALAGDYAVVLMDLQMPEMDGYAATEQLRREGYLKPIIALTAHAMAEERRRCLESGFDAHLSKPINRAAMLQCILEFCESPVRDLGMRPNGMKQPMSEYSAPKAP